MYKEDKIINDLITNLEEQNLINEEIEQIKNENPKILNFINSEKIEYQTMLLNSPWGSGKTYTLKLLSYETFIEKKDLIKKTIMDDNGDFKLEGITTENFDSVNSYNGLVELLNSSNNIRKWNINRLMQNSNKYIFINIDEILNKSNWINELYWNLFSELLKNNFFSSEDDFKTKFKTNLKFFGLEDEEVNKKIKIFLENSKSLIKITPFRYLLETYNLLTFRNQNPEINNKNIEDIYTLLQNHDKTIFIFENLERVSDEKVVNFFGTFNAIFNKIFFNSKDEEIKHKFIFTVDEEVLQNKFNYNTKFKDKFLSKFFNLKIDLKSYDNIKISKFNDILSMLLSTKEDKKQTEKSKNTKFEWLDKYVENFNDNDLFKIHVDEFVIKNYSIRELNNLKQEILLNIQEFININSFIQNREPYGIYFNETINNNLNEWTTFQKLIFIIITNFVLSNYKFLPNDYNNWSETYKKNCYKYEPFGYDDIVKKIISYLHQKISTVEELNEICYFDITKSNFFEWDGKYKHSINFITFNFFTK